MEHTTGKKPVVRTLAYAPLPPKTIVNGQLVEPEVLTTVLREMWRAHKFKTKHVRFSVSSRQVVVRTVPEVDWLPENEFRQSLRYVIDEILPGSVDDFTFDYHVVSESDLPTKREGVTRRVRRVIVVASPKDAIGAFTTALQSAGLTPVSADLTPFSLIRAVAPTGPAGVTEAIIDIGADLATVLIHRDGQPQFVRIIPDKGGNLITEAIERQFLWERGEAESTKTELGLSNTLTSAPAAVPEDSVFGGPAAPATPFANEHPAQEVINSHAAEIVSDIRASLNYYLADAKDVEVLHRIVITGGGSLLRGLPERLASELRTAVTYAAPLTAPFVPEKAAAAARSAGLGEQSWTVAVGTALGENR